MMNLDTTEEFCMIIPKCRPPIKSIKINNKNINSKHIIPKGRPPIRDIKEYKNKNNNNDRSNKNIKKILANSNTFVLERIIKMNSSNEYISTMTDNNSTNDHSDSDISVTDNSENTNHSSNKLSSNDSSHNINPQKPKSPSRPIKKKDEKTNNTEDNKNTKFYFLAVGIVIFAVFIFCFLTFLKDNNQLMQTQKQISKQEEIIQKFRKSVESNKSKFQRQPLGTWNAFQSQVEEIIYENSKVSIVILLGNETNTINCFAHLIGILSSKALGNDNYLTLKTRNIGNDYGEIISNWKAEIMINRVMIIEDLFSMNTESIKALHNLCDKENPLVSKSLYIITIISNGYQGLHKDKFVEDILTAKFSKTIDLDILHPLITRIMDGPIISILPESSIKECLLA